MAATLESSLLDDLEDLSEDEIYVTNHGNSQIDQEMSDFSFLNSDDLDDVSKLQKTERYREIMQKVDSALQKNDFRVSDVRIESIDDSENQLIIDCSALSGDIQKEITAVHEFIRDRYRHKFPELESLVHHPIDYARVVKTIANEVDLTLVDLQGVLPNAVVMTVSMIASTTSGKPLSQDALQTTMEACDRVVALDSARGKLLEFLDCRMVYIAPNLSAVVGSAVAAKLLSHAGGLERLSRMPSCDIQVAGAKKKNLSGFSTVNSGCHVGYLEETELVRNSPPGLRQKARGLVADKSTLAVRFDFARGDQTGLYGRTLHEEICKKIEKWQELPTARTVKPLPVPDLNPKKKRGGRRYRKMKERYAVTDMRKLANRMQFGVAEESSLGDGLGEGYGMLGQAGCGKLHVSVRPSKLAGKAAKKLKQERNGNSGPVSGLISSFALSSVQGIELSNPHANRHQAGGQSTYFSETGTFSKLRV